ncbi:hypothetical protein QFC21_007268 [Naganishia friedmannii]|uniref:Uncharacterized protein n=1 Tax=Naganishia friedmannii TaxID=89922 RepID=A0ACC2UWG2_9TREE|nr:hypothetical protein QFC21_007268 [Naganishia friedmannii]
MSSSVVPRSPMDLPTTKQLLAERIERGEITQEDVDLMKKGYRGMAMATLLGGLIGVPVFIVMGRRRPPPNLVTRLAAAAFMSSTGSVLGFAVGGSASALEVNAHMTDSQRKLRVFEEVMIESKRAAEAQGIYGRGAIPVEKEAPFSQELKTATWDADASERAQESSREQGLTPETIVGQTGSTWDRLREQSRQSGTTNSASASTVDLTRSPSARTSRNNPLALDTTTSSKYAPGMSVEEKIESEAAEERRREQEEFEKLLERERNVAADARGDTGFETGKWR